MSGKRVNLADLAGDAPFAGVPVPGQDRTAPTIRLDRLALNPLNKRDLTARSDYIAELAESLRANGQIQPCAVVTLDAFLAIFPEHTATVGRVTHVQVTGACRWTAASKAGLPTLDVVVKDDLAATRARFLAATAAENFDRANLDLIEEAQQIAVLVDECGTGKEAAEQLKRSPGWVSQRLNLLKLAAELQAALRTGELPQREVRELHRRPVEEQLQALTEWRKVSTARMKADKSRQGKYAGDDQINGDEPSPTTEPVKRRSRLAAAIHRLGTTPQEVAASLRSELPPDAVRALAEELLREDAAAV